MRIFGNLILLIILCNIILGGITTVNSQSEDLPGIIIGMTSDETSNTLDWYFIHSPENQTYIFSTELFDWHSQNYIKWSPDGRTAVIAPCFLQYEPEVQRGCEIYFVDRAGNAEKALDIVYMGMPIWSPDSSTLLFHGGQFTNCQSIVGCPWTLYAIDRDAQVLLTNYQRDPIHGYEIHWEEDGYLYFLQGLATAHQYVNLYRIDMNQSLTNSELVQEEFLPADVYVGQVSPDLKWRFEFADSENPSQCNFNCRLVLVDSYTDETSYLTETTNIQHAVWSPNSESLLISTVEDDVSKIYHLSINEIAPQLLLSSSDQELFLPMYTHRSPIVNLHGVISSDGHAFIYGSRNKDMHQASYHIRSLTGETEISNIFTTDGYTNYAIMD